MLSTSTAENKYRLGEIMIYAKRQGRHKEATICHDHISRRRSEQQKTEEPSSYEKVVAKGTRCPSSSK